MALELRRDGVRQRPDHLLAGLGVLERLEVGGEDVVCLAHGDCERKPVACGRDSLCGDAVRREERVHKVDGGGGRLDEGFDLKSSLVVRVGVGPEVTLPPPWSGAGRTARFLGSRHRTGPSRGRPYRPEQGRYEG